MHANALNTALMPRPTTGLAALSSPALPSDHDKLVTQTEKWVALTFYGTMLKQMRDDPFKSDLFDGGRGGEMFQSLYDQQLADHMSKAAGRKLVNAIVKKIEAKRAYAAHAKGRAALDVSERNLPNVPTNLRG
jgi:Rod binding domain-containing protein